MSCSGSSMFTEVCQPRKGDPPAEKEAFIRRIVGRHGSGESLLYDCEVEVEGGGTEYVEVKPTEMSKHPRDVLVRSFENGVKTADRFADWKNYAFRRMQDFQRIGDRPEDPSLHGIYAIHDAFLRHQDGTPVFRSFLVAWGPDGAEKTWEKERELLLYGNCKPCLASFKAGFWLQWDKPANKLY